jgi:hypothetical protein
VLEGEIALEWEYLKRINNAFYITGRLVVDGPLTPALSLGERELTAKSINQP